MKFLDNTTDRKYTTDIDALNESLYKINRFMRLTKDIDDLKKEQSVRNDIQRKLSMKEQWLKNSCPPSPNGFASRASSLFGSTPSVNSLASTSQLSINAAGSAASSTCKLADESRDKKTLPQSIAEELFGPSSALKDFNASKPDSESEDDELSFLDALELTDTEIKELTTPLADVSSIDQRRRQLALQKSKLDNTLKKIDVQTFSDTFNHIKSQFTNPTVSTSAQLRDLSKFFPKKEEPAAAIALNRNQTELKNVDLTKYFAPSPVQQRKLFGGPSSSAPKKTVPPMQQQRSVCLPDSSAPKIGTRTQPKTFDMTDSQLDGTIDLRISDGRSLGRSGVKNVKQKGEKAKLTKNRQPYEQRTIQSGDPTLPKPIVDLAIFDQLARGLEEQTMTTLERSDTQQFNHMFTKDPDLNGDIDKMFDEVAASAGIAESASPPKLRSNVHQLEKKQSEQPITVKKANKKTNGKCDASLMKKYFNNSNVVANQSETISNTGEREDHRNLTYSTPAPAWCKKSKTHSDWSEDFESRLMAAMPSNLKDQIRELEKNINCDLVLTDSIRENVAKKQVSKPKKTTVPKKKTSRDNDAKVIKICKTKNKLLSKKKPIAPCVDSTNQPVRIESMENTANPTTAPLSITRKIVTTEQFPTNNSHMNSQINVAPQIYPNDNETTNCENKMDDLQATTNMPPHTPEPTKKILFKYKPLTSVGRCIVDYPLYATVIKQPQPERAQLCSVFNSSDMGQVALPNQSEVTIHRELSPLNIVPNPSSSNVLPATRSSSPITVIHPYDLRKFDEPIRPARRPTHRRTVAADDTTDALLERSQAIHNKKLDFMNEKLSSTNPYMRRMQSANQSRESLLSECSNEMASAGRRTPTKRDSLPSVFGDLVSSYAARRKRSNGNGSSYHTDEYVSATRPQALPSVKSFAPASTSSARTSHGARPTLIKQDSNVSVTGSTRSSSNSYHTLDALSGAASSIRLARAGFSRQVPNYTTSTHQTTGHTSATVPAAMPPSRFNIFKRRSPSPSDRNSAATTKTPRKKDGCIIS